MMHFFSLWWHHGNNFPSGLTFGLPLFAWNRIAKVFLLTSASIILLEIIGAERVEQGFARRHGHLVEVIGRYEAWRRGVLRRLTGELSLQLALLRFLFSKERSSAKFTQGRKSLPQAVTLLVLLAGSLALSGLLSLSALFAWPGTPFHRASVAIFLFGMSFVFLMLTGLVLLLGVTAALWLVNAALHGGERGAILGARLALRWMHDKGVARAARTTSFALLLLGFALDMLTS